MEEKKILLQVDKDDVNRRVWFDASFFQVVFYVLLRKRYKRVFVTYK